MLIIIWAVGPGKLPLSLGDSVTDQELLCLGPLLSIIYEYTVIPDVLKEDPESWQLSGWSTACNFSHIPILCPRVKLLMNCQSLGSQN